MFSMLWSMTLLCQIPSCPLTFLMMSFVEGKESCQIYVWSIDIWISQNSVPPSCSPLDSTLGKLGVVSPRQKLGLFLGRRKSHKCPAPWGTSDQGCSCSLVFILPIFPFTLRAPMFSISWLPHIAWFLYSLLISCGHMTRCWPLG